VKGLGIEIDLVIAMVPTKDAGWGSCGFRHAGFLFQSTWSISPTCQGGLGWLRRHSPWSALVISGFHGTSADAFCHSSFETIVPQRTRRTSLAIIASGCIRINNHPDFYSLWSIDFEG
jgi:hypothetical protein